MIQSWCNCLMTQENNIMKQDSYKYCQRITYFTFDKKNLKVCIQNTGRLSIKILTVFTSVPVIKYSSLLLCTFWSMIISETKKSHCKEKQLLDARSPAIKVCSPAHVQQGGQWSSPDVGQHPSFPTGMLFTRLFLQHLIFLAHLIGIYEY